MRRNRDRLSDLPADILLKILSFLPTKHAVATEALSKAWREHRVWTLLSNLDFNEGLLLHPDSSPANEESFISFVENVLALSRLPEEPSTFLLWMTSEVEQPEIVTEWIRRAIRRRVFKLTVNIEDFVEHIRLPICVYTSPILEFLYLGSHFEMDLPPFGGAGAFQKLKVLHITRHFCDEDDVADSLFRNFPVLEELVIDGTVEMLDTVSVNFRIQLPSLQKLKLSLADIAEDCLYDFAGKCSVYIDQCPNLQHLEVVDDFLAAYHVSPLSPLVKAHVDIGVCLKVLEDGSVAEDIFQVDGVMTRAQWVVDSVGSLVSVESLFLSKNTCAALSYADGGGVDLPIFHCLTHLELGVADCCEWRFPTNLFSNTPLLEELVLKKDDEREDSPHVKSSSFNWQQPNSIPALSSLSNLKSVEIWGFEGVGHELVVVEFLLEHGNGLKEMMIVTRKIPAEELTELQRKLAMSVKASETCQIRFL